MIVTLLSENIDFLQTIYEVIVNGKTIVNTPNDKPTTFKNVKVWAAQGKFYPAANARIRKLEYEAQAFKVNKLDSLNA